MHRGMQAVAVQRMRPRGDRGGTIAELQEESCFQDALNQHPLLPSREQGHMYEVRSSRRKGWMCGGLIYLGWNSRRKLVSAH